MDFEVPETEFVLGPSDNQLVITFRILEDVISERTESFTLTLVSGTGYEIGSRSAVRIVIEDNDGML